MKDTQKKKILAVTGMTAIFAISEGIAAAADGHIISENGLTLIAEALEAGDAAIANVATMQGQLTTAQTAQQTAEAALATANTTIAANATQIETLEARVAELEEEPGVKKTKKEADNTSKGKDAFHASAKNPFNQIADSLLGAPVEKAE